MDSLTLHHKTATKKIHVRMKRHSETGNHGRRTNTTQYVNKAVGWAGIRALFMAKSRSIFLDDFFNWLFWLVKLPSCS